MSGTRENSDGDNVNISDFCNIIMPPCLHMPKYPIPKSLMVVLKHGAKHFAGITKDSQRYLDLLSKLPNIQNLNSEQYLLLLPFLLYLEEYQSNVDMERYDLNNQKIKMSKYNKSQIVISVPGLAEDRPSVKVHDKIEVKEVNGTNSAITKITFVGQKYVNAVAPRYFVNEFKDDQLYNIRFYCPNWPFRCCHYAIELIHKCKLTPRVFPEIMPNYNKPKRNLSWFNENIEKNPEQKQAILNIIARTAYPAPYILFGPPGTGKTATLVEAICQILKNVSSSRVLICTPSNAGADEITRRLLKYIPAHDIYRMYGSSRSVNDVDEQILPCSNFVDDEIIFLPKNIIIQKKIVICTLISCTRLLGLHLRRNHFSYVFVDEAGQATEPETLIPLGLISGCGEGHKGNLQGQIIIAGDPKQLGPCVLSRLAEHLLGQSMLERLMEQCAPYQKDKNNQLNPTYITKLVQNYRSHKAILHIPNELFYDNELQVCGGDNIQKATSWSMLPKKNFPVIFHAVDGKEQREAYSPSICNMSEVKVVMDYVKKLIGTKFGKHKLQQKDIGIITPYKLQRMKISDELAKRKLNDITVGTVEVFQGQERDVIILSTVRTVLFMNKGNVHIGFLSNPKRFNVAVTRAKALLIVIGNPKVLRVDNCWKEFLRYCLKNGACRGYPFSLNQDLSRREIQKLRSGKHILKQYRDDDYVSDVEEETVTKLNLELLVPRRTRRLPKLFGLEIDVNSKCNDYQITPERDSRIPGVLSEFDSGVLSYADSNSSNTSTDSEVEIESSSSEISMDELYHEISKLHSTHIEELETTDLYTPTMMTFQRANEDVDCS